MNPRVMVFGPAYLDRVLRVDRPLRAGASELPLDESADGVWKFTGDRSLRVIDPSGLEIEIEPPDDWPGPSGEVALARPVRAGMVSRTSVRAPSWSDDLGGMGAGFAAALGGTLVCPLGARDDPAGRQIEGLLARHGIAHEAVRMEQRRADWTLLLTSGEHGDKLAIGFRECLSALQPTAFDRWLGSPCDLRVVAGLPNAVAAYMLAAPGARCRLFAPAMRNMVDQAYPVSSFAASIDVLCCNRREWEALADREETAWRVSILVITDGPNGALARFTKPDGEAGAVQVPAFPRDRPPRDTNRAGETFASTLISTLLSEGWDTAPGVVDEPLVHHAMLRASAAAALVLDRPEFGFPSNGEIDDIVIVGIVA
ncbi:MAG: carbohydrate kinase family protein [Isosphaeraceae bacterium]